MITPSEFFESPREWSLLKYEILGGYVSQYLPKVNRKYGSAVIADLFAGKGKFDDGTDGSPLIVAKHARTYRHLFGCSNQVILAEQDQQIRSELEFNLAEYIEQRIVFVIPGDAIDVGQQILQRIKPGIPLFVFLDPFGIKGLSMPLLLQIFNRARQESTEVLVNFNHRAVARLVGISRHTASTNPQARSNALRAERILTDCLGGEWWKKVCAEAGNIQQQVDRIRSRYTAIYRQHFKWVGTIPIKMALDDGEAKYFMIFASRSRVAFELMNDTMRKSYLKAAIKEIKSTNQGSLFEEGSGEDFLPSKLNADIPRLSSIIMNESQILASSMKPFVGERANVRLTRPQLRGRLMRRLFGRYASGEYNDGIKLLLKEGKLLSETGKSRISDDVHIRLPEIPQENRLSA